MFKYSHLASLSPWSASLIFPQLSQQSVPLLVQQATVLRHFPGSALMQCQITIKKVSINLYFPPSVGEKVCLPNLTDFGKVAFYMMFKFWKQNLIRYSPNDSSRSLTLSVEYRYRKWVHMSCMKCSIRVRAHWVEW